MTIPSLPIVNPVVVLREEFDDWAVLFNPDTADAVGINPVGVAVWKRLDGRHSIEQIVAEMHDEFTEMPEQAGEAISRFLQQLSENGFISKEAA